MIERELAPGELTYEISRHRHGRRIGCRWDARSPSGELRGGIAKSADAARLAARRWAGLAVGRERESRH